MRLILIVLSFWFMGHEAEGTKIKSKPLSELLSESDHVLICKVLKVLMVDEQGNELEDREARTGPGRGNELRLHLLLQKDGVMQTNSKSVPTELVVSLWQAWHDSLGNRKDMSEGKVFIFLLKEKNGSFGLVYPSGCQLRLTEKPEIERILQQHKQDKNAEPNPGANRR